MLRFWFDRGVAGVRIDSAALLVKDPELGRGARPSRGPASTRSRIATSCTTSTARWRAIADSYAEPRVLVGEIWLPDADRFARYLRPDELHTAFNFDFLACPWEPAALRASIDDDARRARAGRRAGDLGALEPRRDPAGHPLRPRGHVVRVRDEARRARRPISQLGTRRARAAALLAMALPGSLYIYQGEELGLPEVEDIPPSGGRIRCGSAPAASTRAATAAGCRCPWTRRPRRRSGSARHGDRRTLARPARGLGAADGRGAAEPTRLDARALPRRPAAPPRPRRAAATEAALARDAPTTCSPSRAASASSASSTSARRPVALPAGADRPARSSPSTDAPTGTAALPPGHHGLAPPATRRPTDPQRQPLGSHETATTLTKGSDDEVTRRSRSPRWSPCVSLLAVLRELAVSAAPRRQDRSRSASPPDPRQHAGGVQAVQRPGQGVREGEPRHHDQVGRVPVDRPDVRGQARRRHAADVFTCRSPTPDAGRQRPARRHHRRGRRHCRTQQVQPGRHRRGHRRRTARSTRIPTGAYAQALHYNRELFTKAGLDPDKPPTTWDEVAADAKPIAAEDRQGRLHGDGARTTTPAAGS